MLPATRTLKSRQTWMLAGLLAMLTASSGCTLTGGGSNFGCDIPAIPAHRLPDELRVRSREEMQQISISRLRQNPPEVYQLGAGDVLGIYIEFVLGQEGEAPPVHFPEQGDQPPALGYPVPVREDGTLALPLIEPVKVEGLSVTQATEAVRHAYINAEILQPGQDKIIVTLLRRRMYRVLVIREENGGKENVTKRGTGDTIDLPAYENDVLHALNETGGLPGLDAKNEILIIRGGFNQGRDWDQIVAQLSSCREPCSCPPTIPDAPNVTRIPIRYYPNQVPQFDQNDIILETGDIIFIPSREEEHYYTGGAMNGGQHLLPRDYDLDVLGAVAEAGGQVGSGGTGIGSVGGRGGSGGGSGAAGANPSKLIVVRKLPCGGQIPIEVDLNRAMLDQSHRILVQPEDTLILRYRLHEEIYNAALQMVSFNFVRGIR
ncbi:MAG: polysaccharide biosynthesis/export family protein [Planctomycetaceae bacterium]|nr:polysaccharide biosynthesis/export family protein [Planctomycetaceae bacterium]